MIVAKPEKGSMNKVAVEHNPSEERLKELGVTDWPVWTEEVSEFPWSCDTWERCYFLEGDVVVASDGGEPMEMGKGVFVTFPEGMSCTWRIRKDVTKHYSFG